VRIPTLRFGAVVLLAASLVACSGNDGAQGAQGPKGDTGDTGPQGPPGPPAPPAIFITSNTTPDEFAALDIRVTIKSVAFPAATANGPNVTFTLADPDGAPIIGFGSTSQASTATVPMYPNIAFALAKLVPAANGSPSKWVSYIVTTVPTSTAAAAPTRPSTDNTGTLTDHGDGTYDYTFFRDVTTMDATLAAMPPVTAPNDKADLGDVSWQPTLPHRLTIQISGNAPGTGTNTPDGVQLVPGVLLTKAVDVVYDFIPQTGATTTSGREMVANDNCTSCHSTLGGIPGDSAESSGAGFHGGSRNDVRYCVVCHTDQRKYGRAEATYTAATMTFSGNTYRVDGRAVGDLPNLIHKVHLGEMLTKQAYNFGGVLLNETHYSQDIRNCQKCHDASIAATPQGDDWKNNPSRLACGACHDGIDFSTGLGTTITGGTGGHVGGAQADDHACAGCHSPGGIDTKHTPVTPPNTGSALHVAGGNANTNAAWVASNPNRLPSGAIRVTYDVKSVSRDANKHPVIVFRMLQNGVASASTDLLDFATAPVNAASGQKEIWPNFMGSPSAYFVWAVPQDGITAPADFNVSASGYIKNLWNGTATGNGAGTIVADATPQADGSHYYTVTLTGITVIDGAVMLSGGIGYTYSVSSTLPLTQTNLSDYPVPDGSGLVNAGATNKTGGLIVVAPNAQKVATGYTGRRTIVDDSKCNACHQELGTFTEDAFHAGQRNDGTTCAWCHKPSQTSSGWSADSTAFVHAIHGGAKRHVPFTWDASSTTDSFADVKYPGVLARCEQCHVPGSYDFSNSASADAVGLGADQTDKRLYRTVGVGKYIGVAGNTITTYTYSAGVCNAGAQGSAQTALGVFTLSPYVVADASGTTGTYYGFGFSHNAGAAASNSCSTNPSLGTVQADPATLVTSPTVTVCTACHDSDLAKAHMEQMGGSFYAARGTPGTGALGTVEQCFVCHASDRIASIHDVHYR